MCLLTDKIKLCTCKSTNVNALKHYWILHRYNKHKNIDIVDLLMPPEAVNTNYADNKKMLQQSINAADIFDFATDFKAKDVLKITLNANPRGMEENTTFYFQF